MKKIAFLASAAVLLALTACNTLDPSRPDSKAITIDAAIGVPTRATTTGNSEKFDTGDKVALFVWTGSASAIPAQPFWNGIEHELQSDGSWKPASAMYWMNFTSPHYFLGVYPARTVSDFKADSFTLNPADYAASDLLIATRLEGLKSKDNPVSLTFDHALAKLQVNLNFRNQWSATPKVSAVAATAAKTATVDFLAKTLTAGAEKAAVAIPALASPAEGYALSFSGLMIPQSGFRTLTLTVDGKDYVYTNPADLPLVAGKVTVVNLVIGRDKIDLASEITISDWTSQGDAIGGDVFKPAQ